MKNPKIDLQEYQRNYYLAHQEELRRRHREYSREYRKRLKADPLYRPTTYSTPQIEVNAECPICHDTIFGKRRKTFVGDNIMTVDEGCYLWLAARKEKMAVDKLFAV